MNAERTDVLAPCDMGALCIDCRPRPSEACPHASEQSPVVMNYVQFCESRGYPTTHDVESHIHAGLRSAPTTKTYKRSNERKLRELQAARDAGLAAFRDAVASGSVVDPDAGLSRIDRLKAAANGHPDNESTRAAQRLLAKRMGRVQGGAE